MREIFTEVAYLAASVLFILGLRSLSSAATARRGMFQAEVGMLLAVIGTLVNHDIVRYDWIIAGLLLGSAIGTPIAMLVPMTAMPQRIAISHMFGALAATLVGVAEYYLHSGDMGTAKMAAVGFEVMFGSLTITGSFIAFAKLQELITGRALVFKGQNYINIGLFFLTFGLLIYLVFNPTNAQVFYAMIGLALLVGVSMVMRIGGADMPVVISLLNSYAGLASSATGFAIGNNVLIICGALDGASGFLLSVIMSKAMNRSFANVLFGGFGSTQVAGAAVNAAGLSVRPISVEDAAVQLAYARSVIIVPGYGMAVSQAQHEVRKLADLIKERGGDVKFAIHPVAGRMPGHMNVLLAEANVPYDELYEMERINDEFDQCDVALVIGANDVVNPAANTDPSSPIYGMPILKVHNAKSIIVMKRSMNPGFSGIENELFYDPKTFMLFGDAKASLAGLAAEVPQV